MDGRDRHCGGFSTFGVRLSRLVSFMIHVYHLRAHGAHGDFLLNFFCDLCDLRGELQLETR